MTTRSQIINGLKKLMPEMWIKKSEEWSMGKFAPRVYNAIVVTSEDEKSFINGIPAFDYYEELDHMALDDIDDDDDLTPEQKSERRKQLRKNKTYINGIHREIYSFLEKYGWTEFQEWETSGTLVLSNEELL